MYEELTEELAGQIQRRFRQLMSHNADIQRITKKIRAGKASQRDVAKYADFVGKAGSAAMKQVLHLDALPDATMYEEIARDTITPVMDDMWGWVNTRAAEQLRATDAAKGINIGIRTGFEPTRRINEVVNMMAGQTTQEALDNAMTDPVIATARKYYDDFMMENADLRESLGFEQVVIRHYDDRGLHNGKTPCRWCLEREGRFSMQDAHTLGVFNRHPGCGCIIEVITPDKTQVQTDWTRNEWTEI